MTTPNATSTEFTKELDNLFDFSKYPTMKMRTYQTVYKPICNKCGSTDCAIIPIKREGGFKCQK